MSDKLPLVAANLKANKTWQDLVAWLDQVGPRTASFVGTVVVCPPIPFLAAVAVKITGANLSLKLGSQDVSQFEQGPYTGEFAASQIASLCQYAIIGHSERRQNFAEDDQMLEQKFQKATAAGINSIYCVTEPDVIIPDGVKIVAYEPTFAIGTGNPDTPENAQEVASLLKAKGNFMVIYGGSVTGENVASFLKKDLIDGVLVGSSCLDPGSFIDIVESAAI